MGFVFDSTLMELVLGSLLLFSLFYTYMTSRYLYWKNRSIAYVEPRFPFGTERDAIFLRKPIGQFFQSVYTEFSREKVVGMFQLGTPYLLIRDPNLFKHIMTKDFHQFTDRGFIDPELLRPAFRHLFIMEGENWKIMRHKLSPAFTSGKMKMMYYLMEACSDELVKAVEPIAEQNQTILVKDFVASFTTDVIASCAFGLQTNTIKNPENEFRINGNKIFEAPSKLEIVKSIAAFSFPWLIKKLHLMNPIGNVDVEDFFLKIVGDTVAYREEKKVIKNDFIDILIKIKNKSLVDEERDDNSNDANVVDYGEAGLTLEEMTAQAVLFFGAGFETTASTLSFCLYEISVNPEIQAKMRNEIDEVLTKHNGKSSYQALQELIYMDAVINETLRRYSSLPVLHRQCLKDYKLPDLNLIIPKGMKVIIPIYAIHHDPAYYPDPYKFYPERFQDGQTKTKNNYTYMPFGEGPRMCIGIRFAMMQMKLCLVMLLHNFELTITEDTPIPLKISKKHFFTNPESEIKLNVSKRRK